MNFITSTQMSQLKGSKTCQCDDSQCFHSRGQICYAVKAHDWTKGRVLRTRERPTNFCSVGRRGVDEGFEFHWYPGKPPYFIAPDGRKHRCKMRGRVPVIGGDGSNSPQQAAIAAELLAIRRSAHRVLKRLRVFSGEAPSRVRRCSG